jgi:hypothetical protein
MLHFWRKSKIKRRRHRTNAMPPKLAPLREGQEAWLQFLGAGQRIRTWQVVTLPILRRVSRYPAYVRQVQWHNGRVRLHAVPRLAALAPLSGEANHPSWGQTK